MRVFLICVLGKEPWHYGEVLEYDKETHWMVIRHPGVEYDVGQYFNPKGRYNQQDFRLLVTDEDDPYAKFPELRTRYSTRKADGESPRRHQT